jgi:hypothetical protein
MKAVHCGKTKNNKIDLYMIAPVLKGTNSPATYPYPAKRRATRDLLHGRMHLTRRCIELLAHINNTITQYNLPAFKNLI